MANRVKALEQKISELSEAEFSQLAAWFDSLRQARWDKQIETDSQSGRLDFLVEEAAHAKRSGLLRDL
jgi:hypothetical protein